MEIDFITNTKNISFKEELKKHLKKANGFSIASAFVTKESVSMLQTFLRSNRQKYRTGQLLISLYNNFNSIAVLESLVKVAQTSKGKILVRVSRNQFFHWKFYSFETNSGFTAFIGSANFTGQAISGNGELMTRLNFNSRNKTELDYLKALFAEQWANSIDILDLPLKYYKENLQITSAAKLHPQIKKIFNGKKISAPAKRISRPVRATIAWAGLKNETVKKVIDNNKGWKTLDFFCCDTARDFNTYKKIDFILMINKEGHAYSYAIAEIKDHSIVNTSDGRYFIAFREVTKYVKETAKSKSLFESIGINYHKRNFLSKNLTPSMAEEILKYFKEKKYLPASFRR